MATESRERRDEEFRGFHARNIEVLKIHLDAAYECGENETCELLIERLYDMFDELSRLEH